MTTFRKGDIVNVRAKVRYGGDIAGSGYVSLDLGYNGTTVSISQVELVVPHFDLGDRVELDRGEEFGRVRGVTADHVWVERDDGEFATYLARDLVLREPARSDMAASADDPIEDAA